MGFRALLTVLNNSLKNAKILGHNGWFEGYLCIDTLMGSNFNGFRLYFERELLIRIVWVLLLDVQSNSTRDLVRVSQFESLNNPIRSFRRDQSSKVENLFLDEKDVRINQLSYLI